MSIFAKQWMSIWRKVEAWCRMLNDHDVASDVQAQKRYTVQRRRHANALITGSSSKKSPLGSRSVL